METSILLGIATLSALTYALIGYLRCQAPDSPLYFFLTGKSLDVPAITATLLAAQVGGGMFLGATKDPFAGLLYICGVALGLFLLGLGLAQKLQASNVNSIGEVFEKYYQSNSLHQLNDILSLISFSGILVGQVVAAKTVIHQFAGIESNLFFIFFWCVTLSYAALGTFPMVMIADFFRVIFIIATFVGICLYSLITTKTSFFSFETFGGIKAIFESSDISWYFGLKTVLIPAFFCLIEQNLAQKFFCAKTQRIAGISALFTSAALLCFSFIPFYFGIQAKLLRIDTTSSLNPLAYVLRLNTNSFFFTCALCALLAAITSTTDSLLWAINSILGKMIVRKTSVAPSTLYSRLAIFTFGLFILSISYFFSAGVINILVKSYEVALCALLVPFVMCLLLEDLRPRAAWASAVAGLTSFLIFQLPYFTFAKYIVPHQIFLFLEKHAPYAIFITLFISLVIYLITLWHSKTVTPPQQSQANCKVE